MHPIEVSAVKSYALTMGFPAFWVAVDEKGVWHMLKTLCLYIAILSLLALPVHAGVRVYDPSTGTDNFAPAKQGGGLTVQPQGSVSMPQPSVGGISGVRRPSAVPQAVQADAFAGLPNPKDYAPRPPKVDDPFGDIPTNIDTRPPEFANLRIERFERPPLGLVQIFIDPKLMNDNAAKQIAPLLDKESIYTEVYARPNSVDGLLFSSAALFTHSNFGTKIHQDGGERMMKASGAGRYMTVVHYDSEGGKNVYPVTQLGTLLAKLERMEREIGFQ